MSYVILGRIGPYKLISVTLRLDEEKRNRRYRERLFNLVEDPELVRDIETWRYGDKCGLYKSKGEGGRLRMTRNFWVNRVV